MDSNTSRQNDGRIGSPSPWHSSFGALLWGPRTRPLWVTAAVGVAIFTIFRAALVIACRGRFPDASFADILRCFLVGLKFDAIPIGIGLLPMAVVLAVASDSALRGRRFRKLLVIYSATAVTLVIGVEIMGVAWFLHEGKRLNWLALNYVGVEAARFVWHAYPIWLLPPVMAVAYWLGHHLFKRTLGNGEGPTLQRWLRPAYSAALVALCVLASHGGFRGEPDRRGSANVTGNHIISELTLNNFFTVFQAAVMRATDYQKELDMYPFPPVEEAVAETVKMVYQADDEPLGAPDNPLWRRTHTRRPMANYNVVLIIMEGMAGDPVGALGASPSYTPRLDELCTQGLFFDRMYALGARTNRGMVGILCGHPDVVNGSLLKSPRTQGKFLTLPSIFRQRGYRTMMFYGGRAVFDNMRAFFSAGGIETIVEGEDMDPTFRDEVWGAPDESVFDKAHETFETMDREPFFAVILTVSNHDPFGIPPGRVKELPTETKDKELNRANRRLNAYRYADWALGGFLDKARGSSYFDNTIFVLVADHGQELDRSLVPYVPGFRVPCLFYAPGKIAPDVIPTVASQLDIAPTLLAMLGGSYEHCFFGRNLRKVDPATGFAVMHEADSIAMVRGERAVQICPGRGPTLFSVGPKKMEKVFGEEAVAADLERRTLSYYRTGLELFFKESYRAPPPSYAAAGMGAKPRSDP